MPILNYAIYVYPVGPIGFVASIVEVLVCGQNGDEVFCTRIYRTKDDAVAVASRWIEENRQR